MLRLPLRVVLNPSTPEWFQPVAPRYRPANGFLCDKPQERLPNVHARGYAHRPDMPKRGTK